MACINEIGNKYGLLTVLSRADNDKHGRAQWLCQCDCGKTLIVGGSALRKGNTKTCGCRRLSAETAEIGNRYGSLVVESCAGRTDAKKIIWRCKCDCGEYTEVTTGHLHSGLVKTCGNHQGGKNLINETGNRYGKLLVLRKAERPEHVKSTSAFWVCRCDCGNEIVVMGSNLRTGDALSCGCVKSRGEYNITQLLLENQIHFVTQYSFSDLKYKDYLRYDFAILNDQNEPIRLIEFDGPQHTKDNPWNSAEITLRDGLKNAYAINERIPLVRLPYNLRDSVELEDLMSDKYLVTVI